MAFIIEDRLARGDHAHVAGAEGADRVTGRLARRKQAARRVERRDEHAPVRLGQRRDALFEHLALAPVEIGEHLPPRRGQA